MMAFLGLNFTFDRARVGISKRGLIFLRAEVKIISASDSIFWAVSRALDLDLVERLAGAEDRADRAATLTTFFFVVFFFLAT